MKNQGHNRRFRSGVNDNDIRAVKNLQEVDKRLAVDETASETGISVGNANRILSEKNGKVSTKWVLGLLTEQHEMK